MLYSKNGSIPYPTKDDTEGWIEVEDAPVAPEGKEVVWWFPPGWVIRDPMPVKEGFTYSWSQSEQKWNEYETVTPIVDTVVVSEVTSNENTTSFVTASGSLLTSDIVSGLTIDSIPSLTSDQIYQTPEPTGNV